MNTGTAIITISVLALFLGTIYTFTAFLRMVAGALWHSAVLQLVVWAAGIGGVFLFAASQFGPALSVNGLTFRAMNFATKLLLGFSAASLVSLGRDALTAVDRTTSVALPALFWPRRTSTPAPAPAPPAVDPGPTPPPPPPTQAPPPPVAR